MEQTHISYPGNDQPEETGQGIVNKSLPPLSLNPLSRILDRSRIRKIARACMVEWEQEEHRGYCSFDRKCDNHDHCNRAPPPMSNVSANIISPLGLLSLWKRE